MNKEEKVNGTPLFAVGVAFGAFIIIHDEVQHHLGVAGLLYGVLQIVLFGGMMVLERMRPVE